VKEKERKATLKSREEEERKHPLPDFAKRRGEGGSKRSGKKAARIPEKFNGEKKPTVGLLRGWGTIIPLQRGHYGGKELIRKLGSNWGQRKRGKRE